MKENLPGASDGVFDSSVVGFPNSGKVILDGASAGGDGTCVFVSETSSGGVSDSRTTVHGEPDPDDCGLSAIAEVPTEKVKA